MFKYTLRSVLQQNSSDFSLVHIVVDDGSTDDVKGVLKPVKEYFKGLNFELRHPHIAEDLKELLMQRD